MKPSLAVVRQLQALEALAQAQADIKTQLDSIEAKLDALTAPKSGKATKSATADESTK